MPESLWLLFCVFLSRNVYISISLFLCCVDIWGHAVAQLVEVLRYKPEGSGFDYQ
jgi:hypothetical protein